MFQVAIITLSTLALFAGYQYSDIFFSSTTLWPGDNAITNFPMFDYTTEWVRTFHSIPTWFFSKDGGVWYEALTNVYMTLLPNRIAGYLLGGFSTLPTTIVYKTTYLFLGFGGFLIGIYLLARKVFQSKEVAILTAGCFLVSGSFVGTLHQEQVLGTIFYVPFIWYSLLRIKENPKFLLLLGALIGLTLNLHYPQLHLIYGLCLVWSLPFIRLSRSQLSMGISPKYFLGFILCLIITASPLIYTYSQYRNELGSSFRNQATQIGTSDYEEYKNQIGVRWGSSEPEYIKNYFTGTWKTKEERRYDGYLPYVGPQVGFVILLCLLIPVPFRAFQLCVIGLLTFFSLGIHSYGPRLLWNVLPEAPLFRQWYHLTPLINFHLIFLSVFALRKFTQIFSRRNWVRLSLAGFFIVWILGGNLLWSKGALDGYRRYLEGWTPPTTPFLERVFVSGLTHRLNANPKQSNTVLFKNAFRDSGIAWINRDGSLLPLSMEKLYLERVGPGVKIALKESPTQGAGLLIGQFNDRHWILKSGTGHEFSSQENELKALQISKADLGAGFVLERRGSLWGFFLLTSFLLTALILFSLIKQKTYAAN